VKKRRCVRSSSPRGRREIALEQREPHRDVGDVGTEIRMYPSELSRPAEIFKRRSGSAKCSSTSPSMTTSKRSARKFFRLERVQVRDGHLLAGRGRELGGFRVNLHAHVRQPYSLSAAATSPRGSQLQHALIRPAIRMNLACASLVASGSTGM